MKNSLASNIVKVIFIFSLASLSSSCKKVDQPSVDFTINIADPAFSGLNPKGGYIYYNSVIIAHTNAGDYIAVSYTCTHDGTRVIYEAPKNDFFCQKDFSTYTYKGACNGGPANKNLKSYNTALSGNSLHVWG